MLNEKNIRATLTITFLLLLQEITKTRVNAILGESSVLP